MNDTAAIYKPGPNKEFVIRPDQNDYIVAFRNIGDDKLYAAMVRLVKQLDSEPDEHGQYDFIAHVMGMYEVDPNGDPGPEVSDYETVRAMAAQNVPAINRLINQYNRETPEQVQFAHMSRGVAELIMNQIMGGAK